MASSIESDKTLKMRSYYSELIPGLPDELALECLLRVPVAFHPTLRLVSQGWNSTISHPSFYSDRRHLGTAERLVFLVQPPLQQAAVATKDHQSAVGTGGPPVFSLNMYNFTRREWWRVSSVPVIPTFAQCVAVPALGKVVVLGGWDPVTLEPVYKVMALDLRTGTWAVGAPMPTARSFFACVKVGPATIYVAGGHDGQKNALRSAEVYDVSADQWRALPPMAEERDESQGFSFDGEKFWVVSGYGTESQGRFRPDAEVYDPKTGWWTRVDGVWPYPTTTPKSTAAADCRTNRLQQWWFLANGELKEFDWDDKRWKSVSSGRVPRRVSGSSSMSMVGIGDEKIFVMANGEMDEDEGEGGEGGALTLERTKHEDNNNSKSGVRWKQIDTPSRYMGLPFSASQLFI